MTSCVAVGELVADVEICEENVDASDNVFIFESDCVDNDDTDKIDKKDVTLVAVAAKDDDTNEDTVIVYEYIGEFVMD